MLDRKLIRANPDEVRRGIKDRGEKVDLDHFLAIDARRRQLLSETDALKHKKNLLSEEIGGLKRAGKGAAAQLEEVKQLSAAMGGLEEELRKAEAELDDIQARIPNIPHPSVPVGHDPSANVEVRRGGALPELDFKPLPHWQVGEALGLFDLARAPKISGSGFPLLTGLGAKLERALIRFMLDVHTGSHGFSEVWVPMLVKRECLFGTGQLPKLEEDMYLCERDDVFLNPTAEVPITNIYRDEILEQEALPIKLVGYCPSFRRESGSYGKETRGIARVHQFDKVELVKFVTPESSYEELETLLTCAEKILQLLGLPYRVVLLCTGDLSFAASMCYDLEVWAPAEERWLEVSSCSNFESFQARRMGIRYRVEQTRKLEYVHTLNGSGVALPRTLIGILENFQTPAGTIRIPDVVVPYMDGLREIS
ncbi:MAG: serine--tRNA ligase [Candidatus Eiseniibacteriota bacterium]|nr:MAG: serine--tRNA ligase [Candidatus Eisenbacteria bacterium]